MYCNVSVTRPSSGKHLKIITNTILNSNLSYSVPPITSKDTKSLVPLIECRSIYARNIYKDAWKIKLLSKTFKGNSSVSALEAKTWKVSNKPKPEKYPISLTLSK